MKQTINLDQFRCAFQKISNYDCFSYEGYEALFNWIEEYEKGSNKEIELDVIDIYGNFTEYKNFKEFQENCNDVESIEDLQDNPTVIFIPGTNRFIIQNY